MNFNTKRLEQFVKTEYIFQIIIQQSQTYPLLAYLYENYFKYRVQYKANVISLEQMKMSLE